MDIVVVATFQDFDECLEKRQRGPGCGRKHSTQGLLRHLTQQLQEYVRKVDLLVLDWKSPPKQGPKDITVAIGKAEPARWDVFRLLT